jgi:PAS domain S-box-containing protein
MNDLITWDNKVFETEAEKKISALQRMALVIIAALAVTLVANALVDSSHTGIFGEVRKHIELWSQWLLPFASAIAMGAVTILWLLLAELGEWRNRWTGCFVTTEQGWMKTVVSLRGQLAETQLAEKQLEKRNETLELQNAKLQGELDKRKASERVFHEQNRELVRSKDVLEMHVQERTQQIQKLQRRYELILNSAGEGICGLDMEGRTTFVNPAAAEMTGWRVPELIGRFEHEIFGEAIMHSNGTKLDDHPLRRRNGTGFLAEMLKTPIFENGREVGSVVVFKDITERKKAEEALAQKANELARSNAELEQFAFVASHDLQEPLRKIQAFGDRLKVKCEGVNLGEAGDYLERMRNAAARMQTLINDLLTFSRVIRSSQPFVPVDLTAVTREVLGDLEVRIEKNQARVEVSDLPTIDADPTQIRQLIQNLVSNALKFQPPNAQPWVSIDASLTQGQTGNWNGTNGNDQFCEIRVKDNGIGFDEKYLEKIFAVFQRLHGRSEYEGTGVGLAVCRRIVDRHGGSITAKSQPGKGATFIVTLPVRATTTETNL